MPPTKPIAVDGTQSVVAHAARRDFEFAPQELADGDTERVHAGMELVSWTYDQDEWQHHVDASAKRMDGTEMDDGTEQIRTLLFGKRRTEWVADRLEEMPLPTVLFTSTGILFGEIARTWRGRRRLVRAAVERRNPTYLVLSFKRRWVILHWASRELWVPVPRAIQHDADDLAATLNGWSPAATSRRR